MKEVKSESESLELGIAIGSLLSGGEVIELVGDVGAGKTTLTRGIAEGLGVDETIQSPSFTINRTYDAKDGMMLAHYDFYRIQDPGIMASELTEALSDGKTVVIIEWSDTIKELLPSDRLTITIEPTGEDSRRMTMVAGGHVSKRLLEEIRDITH